MSRKIFETDHVLGLTRERIGNEYKPSQFSEEDFSRFRMIDGVRYELSGFSQYENVAQYIYTQVSHTPLSAEEFSEMSMRGLNPFAKPFGRTG